MMLAALLVSPSSALAADDRETRAINYVAQATDTDPVDWVIVATTETDLGTSRSAVWSAKLLNSKADMLRAVIVVPDGRIVDEAAFASLKEQAEASLTVFQRKADPSLRDFAATAQPDDLAELAVFVAADTTDAISKVKAKYGQVEWTADRPDSKDEAVLSQIADELYFAKRSVFEEAEATFAAKVLTYGARPGYRSTSVPLVFLTVPRSKLDAIAALPDVVSMGLEGRWSRPAMAYAGPTVQANWTSGSGDQGTGVRVGVVEYYNVREIGDLSGKVVAFHNRNNAPPIYDPSVPLDHPSWVAGAIASQDSVSKGVAPGALIVSSAAGGYVEDQRDTDVIAAVDWAFDPNGGDVEIANLSLVQDTNAGSEAARKFFDAAQWEHNQLTVAASGNLYLDDPQCPLGDSGSFTAVGSPGTGWNVLTVGGTYEKNTTSWSDDELWFEADLSEGACWEDPDWASWNPHHDFNKPNISAPAKGITTANGWSASGTSVAAPIVSGIAAQLQARNPGYLQYWPEAIRAMIMAGAIHKTPKSSGSYSPAREGVGTVSAKWANNAFVDGGGSLGGVVRITKTSSSDYTKSFSVAANQKVEVAVVWDSHTTGNGTTDTLTADYDLTVTRPDGIVESSSSWDNSYEYVDFTSDRSGTVSVRIHAARFDAPYEYLALAWVKESAP